MEREKRTKKWEKHTINFPFLIRCNKNDPDIASILCQNISDECVYVYKLIKLFLKVLHHTLATCM